MARVKRGYRGSRKRKKILKMAEGYVGGRRRLYRTAKEAVDRALAYAYRDRRQKKRAFRKLWIIRINAAARSNDLSYNRFMSGLKKANVSSDRKMLADLAISDPDGFSRIAALARQNL